MCAHATCINEIPQYEFLRFLPLRYQFQETYPLCKRTRSTWKLRSFTDNSRTGNNVIEERQSKEQRFVPSHNCSRDETTFDAGAVKIILKKNRRVAAALAVVFGYFGIHKFYLGYKHAGIIQIIVTFALALFGSVVSANWPLCVWMMFCNIEGLNYLIVTDDEFEKTYIRNQRTFL